MSFLSRMGCRAFTLVSEAPLAYEVVDLVINDDPVNYPVAFGSTVLACVAYALEIGEVKREAAQLQAESDTAL